MELIRPTIAKKFGFLLLLATCGALLALGVFYSVFSATAADGRFINVAGRQRMLSQQLILYANLVNTWHDDHDRALLRGMTIAFEQSLRALEQGGEVGGQTLPPAPPEVRDEIAAVKRLWEGIRPALLTVAEARAGDLQAMAAYHYAQANLGLLTEASDRVVAAYEARGQALRRRVLDTLLAAAAFDLVLLLAGLWLTGHYVARPIRLVVEAARRIKEGDFSHRVPVVTRDELATLAATFNEMAAGLAQLVAERERTGAQLQYMADHDPLTGLFNRRRFQEELERRLAQARRRGAGGAVMFVDLDGFKHINDTLGHQAGDDLLVSIAGILTGLLGEAGTPARLGGDEFAILLPHADEDRARRVAERILQALGDHHMVVLGQLIDITASIGIALFPAHGTTAEELLAHADLAMYQAKEHGRNDYYVYVPDEGDC